MWRINLYRARIVSQPPFFGLGGIYNQFQPPEVDQLTYLPHLDTPTVILNKQGSLVRPHKYSQEGMLDLLPLPQNHKKLYSIPKQKWLIPVEHIDEQVNAWFDQLDTLGRPKTRRAIEMEPRVTKTLESD